MRDKEDKRKVTEVSWITNYIQSDDRPSITV